MYTLAFQYIFHSKGFPTKEAQKVHNTTNFHPLNPLNTKLNPICHLLALLGAHHILHVSRIRVNMFLLHYLKQFIHVICYQTK